MSKKSKYDLDGATRQFHNHRTAEDNTLFSYICRELRGSPVIKSFLSDICMKCVDTGKNPVDAMGLALAYGLAIGINAAEQERH